MKKTVSWMCLSEIQQTSYQYILPLIPVRLVESLITNHRTYVHFVKRTNMCEFILIQKWIVYLDGLEVLMDVSVDTLRLTNTKPMLPKFKTTRWHINSIKEKFFKIFLNPHIIKEDVWGATVSMAVYKHLWTTQKRKSVTKKDTRWIILAFWFWFVTCTHWILSIKTT